jgi:hypothetical protein
VSVHLPPLESHGVHAVKQLRPGAPLGLSTLLGVPDQPGPHTTCASHFIAGSAGMTAVAFFSVQMPLLAL